MTLVMPWYNHLAQLPLLVAVVSLSSCCHDDYSAGRLSQKLSLTMLLTSNVSLLGSLCNKRQSTYPAADLRNGENKIVR